MSEPVFLAFGTGQPRKETARVHREQNTISYMNRVTAVIRCSSQQCDYSTIHQDVSFHQLSSILDEARGHVCGFGSGFRKHVQLSFSMD